MMHRSPEPGFLGGQSMRIFRFRALLALGALAAMLAVMAVDADARPRVNFGSRGTRTDVAPPATKTAPTQAQPIERTMTQPGQPNANAARPATAPAAPGSGLFNRPGLLGGFAAGFLGAGLIGLLLGHGLGGGLGGLASIMGLLLQIGLIAIVGYLLWSWWQRRSQPAMAGGPSLRDAAPNAQAGLDRFRTLGGLGGLGGASPAPASAGSDTVGLTGADFDQFERLLGDVQAAYGAEDLSRLRTHATPEMLSYFAEDLAANASRGVINRISDVKLLQGDLAEAWREGDVDYATVAMRYSLKDETVERASGRVVEGGSDEATEVWTFMRVRGGAWLLSAIQQV
jgi:predicted lipid-binding transport protein (Tim44 family)